MYKACHCYISIDVAAGRHARQASSRERLRVAISFCFEFVVARFDSYAEIELGLDRVWVALGYEEHFRLENSQISEHTFSEIFV